MDCSLLSLLAHGETGGDGSILIFGEEWFSRGGRVIGVVYDGFSIAVDNCGVFIVGLKLSTGFASGGDIRLEIGGSRVVIFEAARG